MPAVFLRNMAAPITTVRCVNSNCRAEIPDDIAFCPLCGTDQRPPASRTAVLCNQHATIGNGTFCVKCGGGMAAQPATPANHYQQPQHYAAAGAASVQMQEPMDLWAWMMTLSPFFAMPLLLIENLWAYIVVAFLANALFCVLDWKDMEDCGYDAVPWIAGVLLPQVYLLMRAYRRRDQGIYAVVSLALLMSGIYYAGAGVQQAQALEELDQAFEELPDF